MVKNAIMKNDVMEIKRQEGAMNTTSRSDSLQNANFIRYAVPIVLFFIVLFYETIEHTAISGGKFQIDVHWSSEILFFGVIGPLMVFWVLTSMLRLLRNQIDVTAELETLNRTLELKVIERTDALAARNQELAEANEELKQLDRMKSDFVSLVSHELRGPLTSLNGGLEVALQNPEHLPKDSRRILEVMGRETQRLTEFVQTILDVSQLDAGILKLNCGPVAVEPLLHRLVELVYAGSNREVAWKVPEGTPPILVDEIYIEKVIGNLLSNADKYSPPDKPVEIATEVCEGCIEIKFTDYGPGIPEKRQKQVFKRFMRLEDRDRIETKGWGLGLYFAKEITEAQGGELKLKSPAQSNGGGAGCQFTLRLPIADEVPEDA